MPCCRDEATEARETRSPEDAQHRRGIDEIWTSSLASPPSLSPPEFSPYKARHGPRLFNLEGSSSKPALIHSQPRVPSTMRNSELWAQNPSIL